jgi:osmotically-inducible protein OsmY
LELFDDNDATRRRGKKTEAFRRPPTAQDHNEENPMNFKTLAKIALIGAVLIGGSAAQATDTQADWTVTLSVKLALLEKLGTDSLHMTVDTTAGDVTLTGTVVKRETLELAQSVAKSVAGVKSVKNSLHVEANVENPSQAAVAAGETEAELKDATLSTKIRLELVNKMGTDGFRIGTVVANGVVSLEFDKEFSSDRRSEAIKLVKAVGGVTKVISVDKA